MEFTPAAVAERAREYRENEPLYDVEQERIETLPSAFASGEFVWRDVEWVVRWYFRRFLGAYPTAEREAVEDAFRSNGGDDLRTALETVATAGTLADRIEALTALDGVDLRVASAILLFFDPDRYVVVGEREWAVLRAAGELSEPYPDPPSLDEYRRYLKRCRSLADDCECDLWTLYRALWRSWPALDEAEN